MAASIEKSFGLATDEVAAGDQPELARQLTITDPWSPVGNFFRISRCAANGINDCNGGLAIEFVGPRGWQSSRLLDF